MDLFQLLKKKNIPFSLNNSNIVTDGSSLTYCEGEAAGYGWPIKLRGLTPFSTNGSQLYNHGYGGWDTRDLITHAPEVDARLESGRPNIVIVNEIGSELYRLGIVRTAVDRFWTYCDDRRLAGWKVVVWDMTARSYSYYGTTTPAGDNEAQFYAKQAEANEMLANEWQDHCDLLIKMSEVTELQNPYNTTYYTDRIHYTPQSCIIIANKIRDEIVANLN